jgi:hypothetical protein
MKRLVPVLLFVFFSLHLANAQVKKTMPSSKGVKNAPAPAGTKAQKNNPAAAGVQAKSNELGNAAASRKVPPFRAGVLADSLAKLSPSLAGASEALENPFLVLAPNPADAENYALFISVCKQFSLAEGILNRIINSANGKDWLAVAVNNPASLRSISNQKELLFLKAYTFSGLNALEASTEPYVRYLKDEKSLVKMINLQNVDYLPKTSEIKGSNDQIAP